MRRRWWGALGVAALAGAVAALVATWHPDPTPNGDRAIFADAVLRDGHDARLLHVLVTISTGAGGCGVRHPGVRVVDEDDSSVTLDVYAAASRDLPGPLSLCISTPVYDAAVPVRLAHPLGSRRVEFASTEHAPPVLPALEVPTPTGFRGVGSVRFDPLVLAGDDGPVGSLLRAHRTFVDGAERVRVVATAVPTSLADDYGSCVLAPSPHRTNGWTCAAPLLARRCDRLRAG